MAGVLENRQESTDCTRGVTQRLLGLQNCSKISYTNASTVADAPSFPLTGPANLNLYLEKDGAVKAYRFLHQVENSQVRVRKMESAGTTLNNFSYSLTSLQRKKSWNFTFRTESERDTKEVGVKAEVDLENSQVGLDLLFPQTNYNMKGLQLLSISGEFQFIRNERNRHVQVDGSGGGSDVHEGNDQSVFGQDKSRPRHPQQTASLAAEIPAHLQQPELRQS